MQDAINAVTRSTLVEGKTALHNAAFNGNSGVVVLLLDRLRDLLLRDGSVDMIEGAAGGGGVCNSFKLFVSFVGRLPCFILTPRAVQAPTMTIRNDAHNGVPFRGDIRPIEMNHSENLHSRSKPRPLL